MEKLYNCEILDKSTSYTTKPLVRAESDFISNSSETPSLDENNFINYNDVINYTELYKKFKENNNCINSHNKIPVCAYRYPRNTKIANFDELRKELINDRINKEKKEKKKDINYYNADLKIYIPNKSKIDKREKKSLREKIYDGEAIFYEDYIEQIAAKDYEHFFRKPYKIKRQDEGGKYYFYGKKLEVGKEDIYRKYYGLDDEYFVKKLHSKNEKLKKTEDKNLKEKKQGKVKALGNEYQKLNHKDRNFIFKLKGENEMKNIDTYSFYTKNKNIIFDKNLSETKKKELLNGQIPDIILPANNRKTKHPQNCTVPFSRLNTYAKFLEDLLICPYIHNAIDAELGKNWKACENDNIKKLKTEKIKKGYKKDIYVVTKEQLEKSNEKLKSLLDNEKEQESKSDENIKSSINFKIEKAEKENKSVCNGRYMI